MAATAAAAGPEAAKLSDSLAALAAQPTLSLSPELGGLARAISVDPTSDFSQILAFAVASQLPDGFDRELGAALASGDQAALAEAVARLEQEARPKRRDDGLMVGMGVGVERAVAGLRGSLQAEINKGDYTRRNLRARLRVAASALAPLAIWSETAKRQAEIFGELANAATLETAKRWAKGLPLEPDSEWSEAVAVPVTAAEAHERIVEGASEAREANLYSIVRALHGVVEDSRERSAGDFITMELASNRDDAVVASLRLQGDGDGVTLSWSGPVASLPDGSSSPLWKGKMLDIPLALAQRGWDVDRIGPLRYHVHKQSIEPRVAVAKALRIGLRLAGQPNPGIKRVQRSPEYSVDPGQPGIVRLKIEPASSGS